MKILGQVIVFSIEEHLNTPEFVTDVMNKLDRKAKAEGDRLTVYSNPEDLVDRYFTTKVINTVNKAHKKQTCRYLYRNGYNIKDIADMVGLTKKTVIDYVM